MLNNLAWDKKFTDNLLSKDVLDKISNDIFHITAGFNREKLKTLVCKRCGSDEFNVGVGDYYTAIKCKNCKWELCIHDG